MEDELEGNETSGYSISWKMKAETWAPSEAGGGGRDAFERRLAERIDISRDRVDVLMGGRRKTLG